MDRWLFQALAAHSIRGLQFHDICHGNLCSVPYHLFFVLDLGTVAIIGSMEPWYVAVVHPLIPCPSKLVSSTFIREIFP